MADDVLVKAALRKTRAAKTGRYVVEGSTVLTAGAVTVRRAGEYDVAAGRASTDSTFIPDPPDLLRAITGKDVNAADLRSTSVVTTTKAYLNMPAWPAAFRGRWLAFDAGDIEQATGVAADFESAVFPPMLDMLRHASPSTTADNDPAVAHVAVPAGYALLALPSSSTRKMVAAGLDLENLGEEVAVEVRVVDGLIASVSFDAKDAYAAAAAEIGTAAAADQISALPTSIEVTGHGKPVTITVPPPSKILTKEEFERLPRG
ncbi:MAG TPA: hypothetical protein VNA20_08730 [Frankiaceae bacterium]|nr:hypothetical protein [Frankiaceae bacterium]